MIPFVAHVVDKNSTESYCDVLNNECPIDSNRPIHLHDYLTKFQSENYYECDGTEIVDSAMDLNVVEAPGEEDDMTPQQQHQLHGCQNNSKKRKAGSCTGFDSQLDSSLMDEHDHFLYSLAPELRKIDSKFTLHFRNEVHNLIMKYQSMSSNDK